MGFRNTKQIEIHGTRYFFSELKNLNNLNPATCESCFVRVRVFSVYYTDTILVNTRVLFEARFCALGVGQFHRGACPKRRLPKCRPRNSEAAARWWAQEAELPTRPSQSREAVVYGDDEAEYLKP